MNEWTPSAIYLKIRRKKYRKEKDFTGELLCECGKLNHFLLLISEVCKKMDRLSIRICGLFCGSYGFVVNVIILGDNDALKVPGKIFLIDCMCTFIFCCSSSIFASLKNSNFNVFS